MTHGRYRRGRAEGHVPLARLAPPPCLASLASLPSSTARRSALVAACPPPDRPQKWSARVSMRLSACRSTHRSSGVSVSNAATSALTSSAVCIPRSARRARAATRRSCCARPARTRAELHQIPRAVKRKLKVLQYRPEVIDSCLAVTGPTLLERSSEEAEEASPPGGPLNMRRQSAWPVVVALQQFFGNHDIAELDQRPVDPGEVSAV